jgi:hypothetical protein
MKIRITIEYDLDLIPNATAQEIADCLAGEIECWRRGDVDVADIEAAGSEDCKVVWELVEGS